MRGKSKEFNTYLEKAKKGDSKALEYFYDNYYYYIIDQAKFWKDKDTKDLVINFFEKRLRASINNYFENGLTSHMANYIGHAMTRASEMFDNPIDSYLLLARNNPDKIDILRSKLIDEVRKYLYNGLDKNGVAKEYRSKYLYMCMLELEDYINNKSNGSFKIRIDQILRTMTPKKILAAYAKEADLTNLDEVEDVYSYFPKVYTEKYTGMLDPKTVREMYDEKYKVLLERLKNKSSDPDYLSHYFGTNFNSYSFSVKGYERRLISECNKKICKLLRDYEKTLSKEDLKMLRSTYYPVIFEYVKQPKTEDFETFFIKHLINYDLEEAKELRKTYNKYKDEYERRNVLVK